MFYENISTINPVIQALIATLFTWGLTAAGSAMVFFFRTIKESLMNATLGFAAGVMIAASFWSLLAPAISMSESMFSNSWMPAVIGFLAGGAFLFTVDKILPHMHLDMKEGETEGISTTWRRSVLLVLAITLHNFPEGLAVGVAFGAAAVGLPQADITGAVALALGIGIQNFPEGLAVSAPLRREGMKTGKAFWYGQLSGVVEPIAGVLGASAALFMRPILPFVLAFAAGAMIYVVIEELIPEAQNGRHSDLATIGTMLGFAVMMVLDVALG
ncbi:MAG TPA: ZIP family metal transporter [Anaerolineaceae bacterium]|nr:ZIP family metal transporter [Anaerolineaceae bacterium]HPC05650.1 ZIP family metal transporter [Anaerolineaceae bacterium]HQN05010.1 ZIP family metal transporter [Anaerolineaceae bacterium]HQP08144.1 ZIP family metal transporter [Anaerolineaceae bacterium]